MDGVTGLNILMTENYKIVNYGNISTNHRLHPQSKIFEKTIILATNSSQILHGLRCPALQGCDKPRKDNLHLVPLLHWAVHLQTGLKIQKNAQVRFLPLLAPSTSKTIFFEIFNDCHKQELFLGMMLSYRCRRTTDWVTEPQQGLLATEFYQCFCYGLGRITISIQID